MSLSWPWALLALGVVPLLLAVRWWLNRRRKRTAITVSSVALIRAALPGRTAWRRRIPVYLFLAGLLALAGAVARPQASIAVPSNDTTILLAIDVSGSMCNTDIAPNRLAVATDAARGFVEAQEGETKIGLVAFSGIAGLLVAPTTDKQSLLDAIDTLKTARGTAIGQAILTSVDAIAEINPDVAATGVDLGDAAPSPQPQDYEPDTIVVLTDGSNTTGVDPVTAAQEAAARRLRVYTIGFGTTDPQQLVCTADQVSGSGPFGGNGFGGGNGSGSGFGGGGFGGGRAGAREIDEEALTQVADLTGGRYFKAEDAEQLTGVLADLPREFGLTKQNVEISVWFMLIGFLLVTSGAGLSLWWNRGPSRVRTTPTRPHPSRPVPPSD
ncbi:VWA domain-containing protein [Actinoplanes missouriensis]|uniref:VWA domain-containing protein n=1 Tax=Actinoplanes missouriensis TaxID=1866 RepID=UPI0033FB2320